MQIQEFRITYFRSIIDTGWRKFAPDNVTVLVGQNESGKSSILEALSKTLSIENVSADDVRYGDPLPSVYLKMKFSLSEIEEELEEIDLTYKNLITEFLKDNGGIVTLKFTWNKNDKGSYSRTYSIEEPDLLSIWEDSTKNVSALIEIKKAAASISTPKVEGIEPPVIPDTTADISILSNAIFNYSPRVTFFDQTAGILPNTVDVTDDFKLKGDGSVAARNYLTAAGLDLKELITGDTRARENHLSRANAALTKDFAAFWSQTIGKTSKLQLECTVETYGPEVTEKAGKKYLTFWINNGLSRLFPKQRSLGVRWFVSFYLQLRASEKRSLKRVFLLDEPGANLHSKAQSDVLKLINKLSKDIPIVYSTHSPSMIEYDKLYRVLAVQRTGSDDDDSPTEIIPAHELGTASQDTLSPILTTMGVDLSHQGVIKKSNNVLLEEMSGFYYLKAFWEMTKEKTEAHFIAATGVSKTPALANMFLGWGLDFIVVVDDDSHGRGVFNGLKKDLYGDNEALAKQHLYKIAGCPGIEDIFSKDDFTKFILKYKSITYEVANSQYLKDTGNSKLILAFQFLLSVRDGKIAYKNLAEETQNKISNLIKEIKERLQKT